METADTLRELLLTPEEAATMDAHGRTDAAVLVPLYLDTGDLHAVFTKRRDDLSRHAGEISFPGGRLDHPADRGGGGARAEPARPDRRLRNEAAGPPRRAAEDPELHGGRELHLG